MLPVLTSITLIFASLVKTNITSPAGLIEIFVSDCFGLLTRLSVWVSSFQVIEMIGELELDTPSIKNKTDTELVSRTAT